MTVSHPTSSDKGDQEALWRPRETSVAHSIAQYSRFVSIMKLALPIAAGFLLLLIIGLPLVRQERDRFQVGTATINPKDGSLVMTNARYYGTDDKGQPYNVTASGVVQRSANDSAVDLDAPKAEISLNSGTGLSASAASGTYNRERQVLDLSGDVALFQEKGNEIHTTQAQVRLKDGTASGNGDVRGHGPAGSIEAKGFTYSKNEKVLRFHGPARLTLNPKTRPAESPPTETKP